MRSCVRPAAATTSPRIFVSDCGGKIDCMNLSSSSLYCVMPTAAANLTVRGRGNPANAGSSIAPRISRTRSARKLKQRMPSPSRMPAIVADHRRDDELVEFLLPIGIRNDRGRVGKARAVRIDHGRIGLGDALPALVAIHGVIASAHRRDGHLPRQRGEEARHVVAGRLRRRIAAVGPDMHEHRNAGVGDNLRQVDRMILVRVHAAGRHQSHQMAGAAALL